MTHMNKTILNKISFKTQNKNISAFKLLNPFSAFNIKVIDFFDEISQEIFKRNNLRKYADLASFGFFCRKSNLLNFKKKYSINTATRSGRGNSLHFTPTNVPLNFAYSLLFGLITGNNCLIRIGSKEFPEGDILLKIINKILNKTKFRNLKKRILIINYIKNKEITDILSNISDIRLIWGSDTSIDEIRESKLKSHAYDVIFPDRISVCAINSNNYLTNKQYFKEAGNFYNDTFLFNQNACTSPRLIYWVGDKKTNLNARTIFWKSLNLFILKKGDENINNFSIDRLTSEFSSAIDLDAYNQKIINRSKFFSRVLIKKLPFKLENYVSSGGYFLEYTNSEISSLKKILNQKTQTLTTIGFKKEYLIKKLNLLENRGVLRIVTNGRSSEMGFNWDGYNLIYQMTKNIDID